MLSSKLLIPINMSASIMENMVLVVIVYFYFFSTHL